MGNDSLMDIANLRTAMDVAANGYGRDFVVADLHGSYSALMQALGEVEFDRRCDRLFALGDLVDRGEESYQCLSLLREPWFYSILGNHEYMMLSALQQGMESNAWEIWMNNGGYWFVQLAEDQYQNIKALLPQLVELPIALTLTVDGDKQVGLSHAQPPVFDWHKFTKSIQPKEKEIWRALWGRDVVRSRIVTHVNGVCATFHGHTVISAPITLGNMHFLDTGAYIHNRVHLLEINKVLSRSAEQAA